MGWGEIDEETYGLTFDHLNASLQEINKELARAIPQISNLDKLLDEALRKLGKLGLV